MFHKFFRSLQGRVFAGLTLIFLFSVIVLLTSLNTNLKQRFLEQESHIIINYCDAVAGKLNHNLNQAINSIEAVARTKSVRSMDRATLDKYLPSVAEISPFFLWLMVLDRNGIVVSRPSKPKRVGADRSYTDYFQGSMSQGKTVVSETQVSPAGNLSLHIATPIRDDLGNPMGVLSAPIGFADRNPILYSAITHSSLPDKWQVFLVDDNGMLIAHSDQKISKKNLKEMNYADHPAVAKVLDKGPSRTLDQYMYEGKEWYSYASVVGLSNWVVIVQVPHDLIIDHINEVLRPTAIFIFAFFIVMLLCSAAMAKSLLRPLSNLTEALGRFGKKETVEPLEIPPASDLTEAIVAFNSMISERAEMERTRMNASKIESLGHLAGGIAHDFNNMLTGLSTSLALAKNYTDDKERLRERLAKCENAVMRAKGLTHQLLTFSKGGAPIKKSSSIKDVIIDSASFVLRGKDVLFVPKLAEDLNSVNIDPDQISQVIQNLALNAEEASPKGSIITISAENTSVTEQDNLPLDPGNYVVVSVIDQGKGISKDDLAHIFDPYYSTKGSGRGIGLAASRSIIINHGGLLEVESSKQSGAIFRMYLPVSDITPEEAATSVTETDDPFSGRILIMDDEEIIRDSLKEILIIKGLEVMTAADGKEAVALYKKTFDKGVPFDVVIMDLTIPGGMGGLEAIKELKKIDPDVKAIVSSGYSTDPVVSKFEEYGFCDMLAKPFKGQALLAILRKHLSPS